MAFPQCVSACGLQGAAHRLRQMGTAGSGEASLLDEQENFRHKLIVTNYESFSL